MEHVSLHSVATNHKKFGWEKKKNILCRVSKIDTTLQSVRPETLGKVASLPNAKARCSVKVTIVSYRRLLMALCRASLFAEYLVLGKAVFAKCLPVPSVLLSVNVVV
jgi:hypothetical protein